MATKNEEEQTEFSRICNTIRAAPQEPPRYYGYWRYAKGGFANITQCSLCGNVGLYEDCHPGHPCKHCGGNVFFAGAAKWVAPTYKGFLWWKKEKTAGYWMRP